ncbi:MAG: MFS transporter [Proteobacteria bacterium]|nr:MFS transporter [Pseudomonadota bacterium]HQR02912.1 MFS transporter [Rhodocyclaceae bacterium]
MDRDDSMKTAHYALLLLVLTYVLNYIDRNILAVMIEPIKREFDATDTQMGLLTGIFFSALYVGCSIPIGRIADRTTRSGVIAVSCALWSVMTMACAAATNFWQMALIRMGVAIGEAGGTPATLSLIADLYPPRRRAFAMSVYTVAPLFGAFLGVAGGGWLAAHYGWRNAFIAAGLPGLLLGLVIWLTVKDPPRGRWEEGHVATEVPAAQADTLGQSIRRIWSMPVFRMITVAMAMACFFGSALNAWGVSFLVRTHGAVLQDAGMIVGSVTIAFGVAGTLFSGWLCDRLVRRDVRWQLGLPAVGMLLSVPISMAYFLWPVGPGFTMFGVTVPEAVFFLMLYALINMWWMGLGFTAVSKVVPAHLRSVANAFLNTVIGLIGLGMGPTFVGLLSDVFAPHAGQDALRYALAFTAATAVIPAYFFARAIAPYARGRLTDAAMAAAG